MNNIEALYALKHDLTASVQRADTPEKKEKRQNKLTAIIWAINRLDPRLNNYTRVPANQKHYRNTKTYSITMAPEDHDRLVQLGKELHIEGGFSGVLTYIAQNCTLIHEKTDADS